MRLFLLISLLLFNTASAQEPIWREILPDMPDMSFYDISFPDTLHGFISADAGVLLKTKDGGKTWKRINTPLLTPMGVDFADSLFGFINGSFGEGLWRTFNGGKTWVEVTQNIPSTPKEKGNSISSFPFRDGTVYAKFSDNLYRSSDYGDHWKLIYHLETEDVKHGWENKIRFIKVGSRQDANRIYLTVYNEDSDEVSVHLLDSTGKVLIKHLNKSCGFEVFLDDSVVVGRGMSDDPMNLYFVIGKSYNDGKTWKKNMNYPKFYFGELDMCGSVGFSVHGSFRKIYRTYDQGDTWDEYTDTTYSVGATKVKCVTPAKAFIIGETIFATSDSGNTWQNLTPLDHREYKSLHFFDTEQGLIAGTKGTLRFTPDGGENWNNITLPTTQNLNAITFQQEKQGFIVGDSAVVLRSYDSGKNWSKMAFPADKNLFAIHVFDSTRWIIAGQHLISSTQDNGTTWITQSLPDTLRSIDFWDDQNAIAVGDGNTRYHTNDGGKSWFPRTHSDLQLKTIHKVLCYAPQKAFAVATTLKQGGVVLHTSDGGNTWEIRYQNTDPKTKDAYPIYDIVRTADGTLYYTAMNGIAYSNDAGFTWKRQYYRASWWCERLQILSKGSTTGYAVGQGGTVVKTILPNDRPDELPKQEPFCEIYPNPTTHTLNIKYDLKNSTSAEVKLLTLAGQIILRQQLSATASITTVDVSSLTPGTYICQMTTGIGSIYRKVIVIR